MSLYTLALFMHLSGSIGACVSHGIWLYRACRPGLQRASGQCARLPLLTTKEKDAVDQAMVE
jgi:hypothetical protein